MRKKILFLTIILCLFLLSNCKEEDFSTENLAKISNNIISTNYVQKWQNFKNLFKIANKTRYYENQDITLETPRDTQYSTYQTILNECQNFNCTIIRKSIDKNMIFPESIIGNIEFYISSDSAQNFIDSLSKYGNIVINNYEFDTTISSDVEALTKKLNLLNEEYEQTKTILSGPNLQNIEQITQLQDRTNNLNEQISNTNEYIDYLNKQLENRHINIKIRRGFNSAAGFVKGSIHDTLLFLIKYIHIVTILLIFFIIKYTIFYTKTLISYIRYKSQKKHNEKNKIQDLQEPKITPHL